MIMIVRTVPADVPALLALDVHDARQLTVCTTFNVLAKRWRIVHETGSVVCTDEWGVPLLRDSNKHIYGREGSRKEFDMLFARSQQFRFHKQFSIHP